MIDQVPTLVDTGAAAKLLGVSPHTLAVWRATKRYPLPFVKLGRRVCYRLSDLNEFIELNICNKGSLS